MHKKDYEAIAEVFRDAFRFGYKGTPNEVISDLARSMAIVLRADNPRFDRDRFLAACRGEDSKDSAGRKVRYSVKRDKLDVPVSDEQLAR